MCQVHGGDWIYNSGRRTLFIRYFQVSSEAKVFHHLHYINNYFVKRNDNNNDSRPRGEESRSDFQLVQVAQTSASEKGDVGGVGVGIEGVPECNGAKKPSHLLLLPGSKPFCPLDRNNADYLGINSSPSPSLSDTGIVSGEENFAEVHGKYFGHVETPDYQEESGDYSTELVPSPRKDQYL